MEFDKDLAARQEARAAAKAAKQAQHVLADMAQEQLDAIVEAIAKAFSRESAMLADMAVRETGFGNVEDKITKNRFASDTVAEAIRGMKTVGLLREVPGKKLWEIGVPVGVIAAIVPSSAIENRLLITIKEFCSIIIAFFICNQACSGNLLCHFHVSCFFCSGLSHGDNAQKNHKAEQNHNPSAFFCHFTAPHSGMLWLVYQTGTPLSKRLLS